MSDAQAAEPASRREERRQCDTGAGEEGGEEGRRGRREERRQCGAGADGGGGGEGEGRGGCRIKDNRLKRGEYDVSKFNRSN